MLILLKFILEGIKGKEEMEINISMQIFSH